MFSSLYPIGVSIEQRAQDYDKAKQLLSDAGMTSLDVQLVAEEYLEVPQYAQIIQEMCKPAGINIKIQLQSQAQFYGKDESAPWLTVPFGITDWAARAIPSQYFIPMLYDRRRLEQLALEQRGVRQAGQGLRRDARRGRAQGHRHADGHDPDRGTRPSSSRTGSRCCARPLPKVSGVEANGAEFLDLTRASLA